MAKPKLPPLKAELLYGEPEPADIFHDDGLIQVIGGPWATFYRMKCAVDGQPAAAKFIRQIFGDAEFIGYSPYERSNHDRGKIQRDDRSNPERNSETLQPASVPVSL